MRHHERCGGSDPRFFSEVASVLVRTEEELVLWAGGEERFRVPLSEVERVEFPWWFGGGGMRVVVAGERYTLGFTPPAKTQGEVPRAFGDEELRSHLRKMKSPVASLRLGAAALGSRREWKAALADLERG